MHFYEVLVSSPQFHGKEPLTYQHDKKLPIGTVVLVTLRTKPVVAVVITTVKQPKFATKPIDTVVIAEPLPAALLRLLVWLRHYYPAPLGTLAQMVLPSSLLRKKAVSAPAATPPEQQITLPPLTAHQKAGLQQMEAAAGNSFLLHGDTGTGKTRLYLELALQTLAAGRSVLLLTPEIGLTPQLETTVRNSVTAPVITIHSQLTPAERRTVWLQILQATGPVVVIGPRSALFTPLQNLGLIVVDEAHDQAYKQEQAPRYHALRVAAQLAQLHQATLVLGTATPLVGEYALAEAKHIPIIRLTEKPAGEHTGKQITLVDLKQRDNFSTHPYLSNDLLRQTKVALQRKEQVLILLNRRGTARLLLCQNCGWQATCPNCDLPLTYHADRHNLRCHTCGHTQDAPSSCPVCQSADIIFKGIGTKSLTGELQKAFPGARIQRFDTDNLKSERLEQHYQAVVDGKVDILVGTQMLAKGLDLPGLTLVGVVAADSNLYFPDYTAEEQTFQLLTQVIGRVGRGHKPGSIVIQTYAPDSPAIQAAVNQDWDGFYQQQLAERKSFGFPPFYHCLKLSCTRATKPAAETASQQLADSLRRAGLKIQLVGPAPSFYEKVDGKFQWQLIVKAKARAELLAVIPLLPSGWYADLDPINLL